jgi:hypothetical protein
MVFWFGILIAVCFAYSAFKLGFYNAWTLLFNVVIAVYLGIRLAPVIEEFVPFGGRYGPALSLLAAGLVPFLILHAISYAFLLGQFEVTFPIILNKLGSGLLGFLAGFLIWSFAALIVCTTPFSEKPYVKEIGFSKAKFEEAKIQSYLVWWCNIVDWIVSSSDSEQSPDKAVRELLTKADKDSARRRPAQPVLDVNEPNDVNNREDILETLKRQPHTEIPP